MERKLLTAALNQVQVFQELPPLKNGEQKFELAIQGKKIIESPVEELKEVLRLAMLKLGIRGQNLPTEEEKYILLKHIAENYGNHTCSEISLAFDLALAGKLDIEDNDVKAYENFSCLYFSTVMNAYRKWTSEPYRLIAQHKQRLELPYECRGNLSDQEMQQWINEWDCSKVKGLKSIHYIPVEFYDWLIDKKYLELTVEQKKFYYEKSKVMQERQLYDAFASNTSNQPEYDVFMEEKAANKFGWSNKIRLQNLSKKLAVFDYLKDKNNVSADQVVVFDYLKEKDVSADQP